MFLKLQENVAPFWKDLRDQYLFGDGLESLDSACFGIQVISMPLFKFQLFKVSVHSMLVGFLT